MNQALNAPTTVPAARGFTDWDSVAATTKCTNNEDVHTMISDLAEAFSKLEAEDRRVDKIIIPKSEFELLKTETDMAGPITIGDANSSISAASPVIWGAKVEFGNEYNVQSFKRLQNCDRYQNDDLRPDTILYSDCLPGFADAPVSDVRFTVPVHTRCPKIRFKRILKSNLSFHTKTRAQPVRDFPENEWVALDTLRDMISEYDYRKYLKYGFLLVRGASGKIYQVWRNQDHTKVWENGQLLEEVCVRIQDKEVPLTDNVIAFKVIIETDEEYFRSLGNVYNMRQHLQARNNLAEAA